MATIKKADFDRLTRERRKDPEYSARCFRQLARSEPEFHRFIIELCRQTGSRLKEIRELSDEQLVSITANMLALAGRLYEIAKEREEEEFAEKIERMLPSIPLDAQREIAKFMLKKKK